MKNKLKSLSIILAILVTLLTPMSSFANMETMEIVDSDSQNQIGSTYADDHITKEIEKLEDSNEEGIQEDWEEIPVNVGDDAPLEDEPQVSADIIVTNFDELKDAIAEKQPVIKVSGEIIMTEQIAINYEATITGINDATIKSGTSGFNYMFKVNNNTTFSDLNFDGNDQNGAIQCLNANLTIKNSKFNNNRASHYGAIHIWGKSDLNVSNSSFENNNTNNWFGGAIYFEKVEGTSNISNTIFKGNSGKYGGGIAVNNSILELNLEENEFNKNKSGSQGGALYFYDSSGIITDNSSIFKENNSDSHGGAIYIAPSEKGVITNFTGSQFIENEITAGLGTEGSKNTEKAIPASFGGAIFFYSTPGKVFEIANQLNITNTIFDGNKNITNPTGTGGAIGIFGLKESIIKIINSTFTKNESTRGGAILTGNEFEGDLKIEDTKFSYNIAEKGGAIYYNGGGSFDIKNSTFHENMANEESGGAIYFYPENTNVSVSNSNFKNNNAQLGGAVLITNGEENTKSSFIFEEVCFENNNATDYYGGAIATMALKGATINLKNSNFIENSAKEGGAIYISSAAKNTLEINNSNFTGNSAKEGKGGAIYLYKSELDIKNTKFNSNSALGYGGGIHIDSTAGAVIDESTFIGNYSGNNGGAINILPETNEVTKDIEDNQYFKPLKVSNTSFKDNIAKNGIYELDKTTYPTIFATYNANITGIKDLSNPATLDKDFTYNNYDISFISDRSIIENVTITYDTNGGTGNQTDTKNPYKKNAEVTVLDKGTITRDGYAFIGWNTNADGTRANYNPGDIFVITDNITLYAVWEKVETKPEDKEDPKEYSSIIWDWQYSATPTEEPLLHRAYLNGYPDGSIKPAGEITRGEVAAVMSRLHADKEEIQYETDTKYKDVKTTDWYAKHISYVTNKNLMEGYEDGTFQPESKITRAEYATVVARFKNLTKIDTSFTDAQGHWAKGYIGTVANKGWITGYPDGTFKPMNNITREEVSTMTNKMLDRKVDKDGIGALIIKEFKDLDENSWSYYDMVEASNSHHYVRRIVGDIMENWKDLINNI